jgi:glycosyltransferase involved in cell wall biosynthesis
MISTGKRVLLAYKNFAANRNISHIGLGVAAMNTAKSLRQHGFTVDVIPIVNAGELEARLNPDVSHVVVSAPWIPTPDWQRILRRYSDVRFAVNCHSNVGFLQADANGVKLVREAMEIERGAWNFHVAANSRKFARWLTDTYSTPCEYLPNLYYLESTPAPRRPLFSGNNLRIGAFGATRPLKNFMSAAGAAAEVAAQLHTELELWVSAGRTEGGGGSILEAVRSMIGGLPNVRLVECGWQSWPKFRVTVRHMHLLMQPSYTESFNMVTADGVAEGIPSVVSEAIEWAPDHWKAPVDDVQQIARVARYLLADPHAPEDGLLALRRHNRDGLESWKSFLAN